MPTAFSTARLAFRLAGLKAGQRVLIHAAGGGVGLAAVQLSERDPGGRSKTGFIDRSGRLVIDAVYDWALCFSDGLATVRMGGNWGFIDRTGTMVIAPQWNKSFNFEGQLTLVGTDHKLFYINRAGEVIWNPYT